MKAPDKIYLPVIASPLLHRDVIENHWMEVQSPFAKENIAYIRKDALTEWLEGCKNNSVITDLQKANIQELIDKINSL